MRAREFTINVPITIKINGDGDPEIDMPGHDDAVDPEEKDDNPLMVPPLQQDLELRKSQAGKDSPALSDPYLTNAAEFAAYRSDVRKIAVNPPAIVDTWPVEPNTVWAYTSK